MISLVTKLSANTLRHNFGLARLNSRFRNHCEKKEKYTLYTPPKPMTEAKTGSTVTRLLITFLGFGTIGYAIFDEDFRTLLEDNITGADRFFKFILPVVDSTTEYLTQYADSIISKDNKTSRTVSNTDGSTIEKPIIGAITDYVFDHVTEFVDSIINKDNKTSTGSNPDVRTIKKKPPKID